jgi:hypothetical protein
VRELATRREWFCQLGLPSAFLFGIALVWSGAVNALTYHSLGVSTSVDGRTLSFVDNLFFRIPDGGQFVFWINLFLLLALALLRVHFRWWVVFATMVLAGTPLAVLMGRSIARYLWAMNKGGVPWEDVLPAPVTMGIVWMVALVADAVIDWRLRVHARGLILKGIYPECSYDLRGSIAGGSARCPECGAPIQSRPPIEG